MCLRHPVVTQYSVLISRLRIGHCRLTDSYLLSGDDRPTCTFCVLPLTVKHILLECTNLQDIRENILLSLWTIIDCIKETHFYHQP